MKKASEILKEKCIKFDIKFSKKQTALIIEAMNCYFESAYEPTEVNKIIKILNDYYGVNCVEDTREGQVVKARQLAIYFIRFYLHLSIMNIGIMFNKHHATVLHSLKTVENMMFTNKEYSMQMIEIKRRIERILYEKN